jgi:hypothetical protein
MPKEWGNTYVKIVSLFLFFVFNLIKFHEGLNFLKRLTQENTPNQRFSTNFTPIN